MQVDGFEVFNPYPLVDFFDGPEWDDLTPVGYDLSFGAGNLDAFEVIDLAMVPDNSDALKALTARLQVAGQPSSLFPTLMYDNPLIQSTSKIWLTSQKDAASHLQGGLIIRGYETGDYYVYLLILEGTGIQQAALLRSDTNGIAILKQQIIDPVAGNPDPVIKNGNIVGLEVDTYDDPVGPAFKIRYTLNNGADWVEDTIVDGDRSDLLDLPGAAGVFLIGNTIAAGDQFTVGGFQVISNEV